MPGRYLRILLDAEATPPENKGGAAEVTTPPAKGQEGTPDLNKAAEGLIKRHGDSTAALLVLLGENHTYREKNRTLEAQIPKDGAVVLSGDDAKHWADYRKLGNPADVRRSIEEGATAKAEAGTYRKAEVIRSAAKATKIDGVAIDPEVLGTLAKDLEIVVEDLVDDKGVPIGEDGKPLPKDKPPVKAAFVKGDGDTRTRLDGYAKANWGKFIPSLKAEATARSSGSPDTHRDRSIPARSSTSTAANAPPRRRSSL